MFMPSKNTVKTYVPDGIYHIYNRGVEKRSIFVNDKDYRVFLNLLKLILTPEEELEDTDYITVKNKSESVELLSYCLMSNHFHLIIKQHDETGMTEFMRILSNAYVYYFNNRYKRVGSLFQGRYKAALIDKDEYLIHVSRYIHLNPLDTDSPLEDYPYSSYKHCLNINKKPLWLNPSPILEQFNTVNEYKKFVEDQKTDSQQIIGSLSLDN